MILVVGGEGGNKAYDTVEAYYTATNSWRVLEPMPTARHGIQAVVCDGGVYVAAGGETQGGSNPTDVHEVYFLTEPTLCGAAASGNVAERNAMGLYSHNHHVMDNDPPEGGAPAFRPLEFKALPVWLRDAGYVGKYLNTYDGTYVPPGWDEWKGRVVGLPYLGKDQVQGFGMDGKNAAGRTHTRPLQMRQTRSSGGAPE